MKKQGVVSLGEPFVDFIAVDQTNTNYQKLLGGATVNVAVSVRRLGIPSYYLCTLGTNTVSQFVEDQFLEEQINYEYCIQTEDKEICEVYVHLNESGDRVFHSYRNNTPDEVLSPEQLSFEVFEKGKLFYFGSGTLFHPKARQTSQKAVRYAKKNNTLVAFDANLRLKRWDSEVDCRKTVQSFLQYPEIIKLSEEELLFLTETKSMDAGLSKIALWNIPYLFITMASDGAFAVVNGEKLYVPGFKVEAVDTTGAGDAFMAALLYCFHEKGHPKDTTQVKEYMEFANNLAAISKTMVGALTALPKKEF